MKTSIPSVLLVAAVLCLSIACCLVGYYPVHLRDLVASIGSRRTGDPLALYVLTVLRLPRLLAGLMVGASAALAGGITQAVLHNPLADAGVLGVASAASFAALFCLLVFHVPVGLLPLMAFLGAVISGICVLSVSGRFGDAAEEGVASMRVILSGLMTAVVLSAGTLALVSFGELFQSSEMLRWTAGSLADVGWMRALPVLISFPVLFPIVVLSARTLRVHTLGADSARSVGARISVEKPRVLLIAAALVGVAVSVAGPVAFVGLIAPNAVRSWHPSLDSGFVVQTALLGALLVSGADLIGRSVFSPLEVPYGLITAIVGAPCLLLLLLRRADSL